MPGEADAAHMTGMFDFSGGGVEVPGRAAAAGEGRVPVDPSGDSDAQLAEQRGGAGLFRDQQVRCPARAAAAGQLQVRGSWVIARRGAVAFTL